ncbi:MAG TPA: hypothetical protein DEG71_09925 [Clostridiales bacterium]|nr:hypothetical protein [Clostridiales bacterium]
MNQYTFHYKINSYVLGYSAYLKILVESSLEPQKEILNMAIIMSKETGIDVKEFIPIRKKEYKRNKDKHVYIVNK